MVFSAIRTITAILLLGCATTAIGAEPKIQYKCHFELIGGQKVVHHIVSTAKNAQGVQGQMNGRPIYAKDGVTKKYIYQVFECVGVKQKFSSVDAQALDAVTPS
jgi:hypothetical protein